MSKNMQQNDSNRSSRQTSSQSITSLPHSRPGRPPSELLCDLHVYKVPPELWREAFNNILNNAVTETVSVGIIRVPMEIRLLDIREEIVQQLGMTTEELLPRDYVFLRCVGRSLTTTSILIEYGDALCRWHRHTACSVEKPVFAICALSAVQMLDTHVADVLQSFYQCHSHIHQKFQSLLRLKQEYQLKAKHFIPPVAYAPELFILEATPEVREALAGSNASSQSPPLSRLTSPRNYPNTYRVPIGVPEAERRNKPYNGTSSPGHKHKALPHIGPDPYRGRDIKRYSNPDPYNHTQTSPSPHSGNSPHNDPYNMNHHSKKNRKNSLKHNKQPYEVNSGQPGSDWDEQPESKQSTKQPPLKRSPLQSAEKGKNRRHDDDSGVAGLSPEDDSDNIFRKAKDLQKHLDSDRFSFDETEEEKRRRLEDLESRNLIDRERWDADQDERRRRAKEDRLKENERKREKEDEERRQKEDQERKKRHEEEKRKKEEGERGEEVERKKRENEEKKRQEEEKRKQDEEKKRREEEKKREEEEKRKQDEDKKRREEEKKRELEKKEKEDSERKKIEEIEKRRKDEQEKRRKEDEEERKQREERERQKEEENRRKLKEEIRSPAPAEVIRDTESARQRRRDDKNQLLKEIEEAKQARQDQEKIREELVRKAKQMQHKTTNRRNEARDMWKKKYFEEKKKTAPLEENSNRLRNELEALHKRLVNTLEGLDPKEKHLRIADARPVEKNNYVIQSTKLQHEIEDLQRRVENARMKLTAEMKLRNQAQGELRALRAELTQRMQTIELNRQHQLASLNSPRRGSKENSSPSENTHSDHYKSFIEGS